MSDALFVPLKKRNSLKELLDHGSEAFSSLPDIPWKIDDLEGLLKEKWEIYGLKVEDSFVAAAFLKEEEDGLATKNTPIKMGFNGRGLSHQMKDFFEREAKKRQLARVTHYCRPDNFRAIALNESHGYKEKEISKSDSTYLLWEKKLV